MSKIGKRAITIPSGVAVSIQELTDGFVVKAKGAGGELEKKLPKGFDLEVKEDKVFLRPAKKAGASRAAWGLWRALLNNLIQGASKHFERKLELEGVGYRAALQGTKLVLSVGFTHPVELEAPAGVSFQVEKNIITVSGADKAAVGQIAADIRAVRPPEPYKGKGIRYQGEVVRRKAGKKAATAGSA